MPRPRKSASRTYWKTIYAVVEGDKTEVEYIKFLKTVLPGKHGLQIIHESPGSARATLFRRAKQIVRGSDEDTEVWILCDVDDEGAELAQLTRERFPGEERLNWAISNPEFALWLVMHFSDCTKWADRSVYARQAKALGISVGKRGKDIDKHKLIGCASLAANNAILARNRHVLSGNKLPHNNPQSDVDKFVGRVVELYNEHLPPGQDKLSLPTLY